MTIKSTLDPSVTVQYAGLIVQLVTMASGAVRELDPSNALTFLRLRTKKHEIMVAPGKPVILCVCVCVYLYLPFGYYLVCLYRCLRLLRAEEVLFGCICISGIGDSIDSVLPSPPPFVIFLCIYFCLNAMCTALCILYTQTLFYYCYYLHGRAACPLPLILLFSICHNIHSRFFICSHTLTYFTHSHLRTHIRTYRQGVLPSCNPEPNGCVK